MSSVAADASIANTTLITATASPPTRMPTSVLAPPALPARFIATVAPGLERSALQELRHAAGALRKRRSLGKGIVLIETVGPHACLTEALQRREPMLVKHLMPVHAEIRLDGLREADLPALLALAQRVSALESGDRFAVQCRCVRVAGVAGVSGGYNA